MASEKDQDHRTGTDDSEAVPQSEAAQQENAPTSTTAGEVNISKPSHVLTENDTLPAMSSAADHAAQSDAPASQQEVYAATITPNPPKDGSPKVPASATEETTSNTTAIPQEDRCDHDEPSSQTRVGSEPTSPTDKTQSSELPSGELYEQFLTAAEEGDEAKIESILLTPNLDVNFKNNQGDAALHKAAKNGHLGVIKKLVQLHAIVDIRDNEKKTPLSWAARYGYLDLVKELLRGRVEVDAQDEDNWTPLHLASYFHHLDVVKELLSYPANPDAETDEGETPLHLATLKHALNVVKELLNHPCNINATNDDDETPLFQAAKHGYTDIVKELLTKKANTKAKDMYGQTPLHVASFFDHVKVAEELLKSGADINQQDGKGWTPLFGATTQENPDMVQFLLNWKEPVADISIQSFEGMTPFDKAARLAMEQRRNDTNETRDQEDGRDEDKEEAKDEEKEEKEENEENEKKDPSPYEKVMKHLLNKMKDDDKEKELVRMASREEDNKLWSFLFKEIEWTDPSVKPDIEKRIHLIWLAASKHYPELKGLLQKETSDNPPLIGGATENYDVLQWASFLGRYEIVWWLIRNGSFDKSRQDEAFKVAKAQRDLSQSDSTIQKDHTKDKFRVSSKIKNKDYRREAQKPESGLERTASKQPTREKFTITMDILKDPPFIDEGKEPHTVFEKPKCPEAFKKPIAGHFDATIVDFYRQDRRIDFLRQSREVVDVIYKIGPGKIMRDAMDMLAKISPDAVKKTEDMRENFCFRWIHLPANSLDWMMDLMTTLHWEKRERAQYNGAKKFFQKSLQDLPGNLSHAPFMGPWCSRETVGSEISKRKEFTRVALYMPYLNFGTYHCSNNQLGANSGETDSPLWKKKDDWLKETFEDRVYRSRTLDQFYFHLFQNTDRRDHDQIATKYIDKVTDRDPGHRGDSFEILRVDHLWLWIIDDKTVITSSTHRNDDKNEIILEEVLKHLREYKTRVNGEIPPSSVQEISELITWDCIKFLNHLTWKRDGFTSHNISEDQTLVNEKAHNAKEFTASIHQMFAYTLNDMSDKEAELLGDFVKKVRAKLDKLKSADKSQETGGLGKQAELETNPSVSNIDSKSDRAQSLLLGEEGDGVFQEREQEQKYDSIYNASSLLHDVKDIRDELEILRFLLQQQRTVWDRLLTTPSTTKGQRQDGTSADESRKTTQSRDVGQLILDIEESEKTARKIHDSINTILSLEQNEASLLEAEEARRLTAVTIQQGRTLMAFTIVTILFLPLSFLTSLFALDVTIFPHQGTNLLYSPGWVFPAIFAPAVGFSAIVIIIAFYAGKIKNVMEQPPKPNSSQSRPLNQTSTSTDSPSLSSRGRNLKSGNPLNFLGKAILNWMRRRRDDTTRAQQDSSVYLA